jgi:hypothetical protein
MTMLHRFAALLLLLGAVAAANARGPAPGPDCLDARALERVRTIDPNTLLVASGNGRFVVAHATGCSAGTPEAPSRLVAREGWACGAEREFLQEGDSLCPLLSVTRVDARVYAGLAAAADGHSFARRGEGRPTLAPVEVTAATSRPRGFRGDTDYCFPIRAVRGWKPSPEGVVVLTSPNRAGGKRRYRVEFTSSCPEIEWAEAVDFQSGVSIGMICGHPGDRVTMLEETGVFGEEATEQGAPARIGWNPASTGYRGACFIASVFPEEE